MFSPPANLQELVSALRIEWHDKVLSWFKDAQAGVVKEVGTAEPVYFFNLEDSPQGANGPTRNIFWNGFPRKYLLVIPDPNSRWETVGRVVNLDLQGRRHPYYYRTAAGFSPAQDIFFRDHDEYCEWREQFDPATGELIRVTFTCENPEYWSLIAQKDPGLLLKLYRELVGPQVQQTELFFDRDIFYPDKNKNLVNLRGKYNPHNRWNSSDGIVHLSHPANSLVAEVFLAAEATVVRTDRGGTVITDDGRLICCSAYGAPDRSSDPTIGGRINQLVRQGLSVTIDDPVGLYIHSMDSAGVDFPTGVAFEDCWHVIRGDGQRNQILRAEFRPPSGVRSSQIAVKGVPLRWGGQLAELINMVIYGRAFDFGHGAPKAHTCVGHCCPHPTLPGLQEPKDINVPCPTPPAPIVLGAFKIDLVEASRYIGISLGSIPDLCNLPDHRRRI